MEDPQTPQTMGFGLPPEWAPQEAIWFAWPVRRALWPHCFDQVRLQLAALYVLAARYQTVRVLCGADEQEGLRALMTLAGDASRVELYDYQCDDVWIRDFGPLFLLSSDGTDVAMADWRFNAWGDKFPQHERDDRASRWIAGQIGVRRFEVGQVLEGGAIEANGNGDLLTTEAVLLNPSRHGPSSKAAWEMPLKDGLGVERVLWLNEGLQGDDTDGHIDNLARFFKEDGILYADVRDPKNINAPALDENLARLKTFRTKEGRPFELVALPLPDLIFDEEAPLAASYLNYVVLNGAVLVPTYGQADNDRRAMEILADCFPGREVVGVDCRSIILEGGALHCMSQHQSAIR